MGAWFLRMHGYAVPSACENALSWFAVTDCVGCIVPRSVGLNCIVEGGGMREGADSVAEDLARILQSAGALLTGDFELKNGKRSNYFIDFGRIPSGEELREVGRCYAEFIEKQIGLETFDVIFGPAVKGIALAIATSMALCLRPGSGSLPSRKGFAFNRLWPKEYGETGLFLGQRLNNSTRVLVVDDVITDGHTKRDTVELIRKQTGASVVAVVVGVDRSEDEEMAERFERELNVPLRFILSGEHVRQLLEKAQNGYGGGQSAWPAAPTLQGQTRQRGVSR